MNEDQRKKWNADRLAELYPLFRDKISAVVIELESQGLRPRIHEAWRSLEDQLKAFDSHHSQLKYGFHNVTAANGTKEALAVDMVDDDIENHVANHERAEFLLRLAAAAEKQGLVTGIRWGLPPELQAAIDNAIANEDWKAPLKHFSFDPAHVEPTGITPEDAKKGQRPS